MGSRVYIKHTMACSYGRALRCYRENQCNLRNRKYIVFNTQKEFRDDRSASHLFVDMEMKQCQFDGLVQERRNSSALTMEDVFLARTHRIYLPYLVQCHCFLSGY